MASTERLIRLIIRVEDEASKGFDKVAAQLDSVGQKMTSLGQKMTVGVTAPIVAAGIAATKAAIDWESAFTGVTKTVDGTTEQLTELEKGLRNLATDSTLAAMDNAHEQIAGIAEAAGQLGVKVENIEEFTYVIGQLAQSTNIAGEEGARMIAQFANVAKMPLSDIRKFGDAIVTLGNNAATTEKDILSMASRLGSIADVGFKPDEILAYSSALASLGISAELGGTNFMKGVNEIASAVSIGGEKLEHIADIADMTAQQFKQAFEVDASGALESFINGLSGLNRAEQLQALEKIGLTGQEASRVFLSLAGNTELLAEQLDLASGAFAGNNALMDEATKRALTVQGQINTLKSRFGELAIQFGELFLPILIKLVEGLSWLVNKLLLLPEPVKAIIAGVLAIVAAVGPLLILFGSIASSATTLIPIIAAIGTGLMSIVPAIWAVIAPIAPLLLAIGALALALNFWEQNNTTEVWRTNFEMLGTITELGTKKINNTLNQSGKTWQTNFKMMGTIVRQVADKAKNAFGQLATGIANSFKSILPAIKTLGIGIMQGLIEGVKSKISQWLDTLRNVAKQAVDIVKKAFGIASPSKEMMKLGNFVVEGFNKGVEQMGGIGVNVPSVGSSSSAQPTIGTPVMAGASGGGDTIIINPPFGTTQDQVDFILEAIGKRATKRGARKGN